jgi:DNA polymerase lambda
VTTQDAPPTSPIEDASGLYAEHEPLGSTSPARKMTTLKAGPSRLYLEVKERVAKHASSKRRDKVIKLAKKDTTTILAVAPDESSIIYVSSAPPSRSSSPNPGVASLKTDPKKAPPAKVDKTKVKPIKPKKAGKPPPMKPAEYVQYMQEKARIAQGKLAQEPEKGVGSEKIGKKSPFKFLQDKHIMYIGGDMVYASERTRGRMECVRSILSLHAPVIHPIIF